MPKSTQRIFSEDAKWAEREAKRLNEKSTSRETMASVIHRAIEAYRKSSKE